MSSVSTEGVTHVYGRREVYLYGQRRSAAIEVAKPHLFLGAGGWLAAILAPNGVFEYGAGSTPARAYAELRSFQCSQRVPAQPEKRERWSHSAKAWVPIKESAQCE